ncbi:MAG TPA: hypothetical protein VL354_08670 [Spirochaetia bacterium]|nr:hypothetical protein [Spirochaetia bacterium]
MSSTNWEPGISLRMSRLFDKESGNSVVIAMDHSAVFGALKGLEDAGGALDTIVAGEPDGVLLPGGAARGFQNRLAGRGAPALIIALDFPIFFPYPGSAVTVEEQGVMVSPEEALRLGADMVKILLIFGREQPSVQARNFAQTAQLVEKCHSLGLPVMLEPTAWGLRFDPKTAKEAGVLRDMARVAAEFGADVVKTDYPENPREFSLIASACPVPLLALGGSKKPSEEDLLREVLVLIENGARGVTFGRNVLQGRSPERMVRAIRKAVHHRDLEAGLEELRGK